MLDKGWDMHPHASGPHYAGRADGTWSKFRREGNRFRLDAEVVLPENGQKDMTSYKARQSSVRPVEKEINVNENRNTASQSDGEDNY